MITFDQIIEVVSGVLHKHSESLPGIGPIIVNRDLNGRVRLIVGEEIQRKPKELTGLSEICAQLQTDLGPHGYPADNAVLFEEDINSACEGATKVPLDGFNEVFLVDRMATEGDWASIAPETGGVPRIVFFSIKGGVGRSTALAATAWTLAQAGKRVLVVDLDLESPGLSSTFIPRENAPAYGIVDWLVEDLVDNGETVIGSLFVSSPLSHDGEIYVVPAHGRNPGDYVSKLGRVWMPKVQSDLERESWSKRLGRLISSLEERLTPDVILIDSRAGIDEVASSCVTDLGANLVLLFAIEGTQTWSGYRILFDYWRRYEAARQVRTRLQVVGAMVPDDERRNAYFDELRESSHSLFQAELYDEIPPDDLGVERFAFALEDEHAPHYPWVVSWNLGFTVVQSMHDRLKTIDPTRVNNVFGDLLTRIADFVDDRRTT